jgi:hypothetical protein
VKSLGITFAFFGMIATVAAIADINSGRYDLVLISHMMRGGLYVFLGMLLFVVGMVLVKIDGENHQNEKNQRLS